MLTAYQSHGAGLRRRSHDQSQEAARERLLGVGSGRKARVSPRLPDGVQRREDGPRLRPGREAPLEVIAQET